MAVEVTTRQTFQAGKPSPLGALNFAYSNVNYSFGSLWVSSADGKCFLTRENPSGSQPYTVVLNWQ
jgi:hypothetical protein